MLTHAPAAPLTHPVTPSGRRGLGAPVRCSYRPCSNVTATRTRTMVLICLGIALIALKYLEIGMTEPRREPRLKETQRNAPGFRLPRRMALC